MSLKHPSLVEFDKKIKNALDELDDMLEDQYGSDYVLHPARSKRGKTSDKAADGLFDITAGFSAGYGSEYGKGYIVKVRMSTLQNIPENIRTEIEIKVIDTLRKQLPQYFPGRNLQVDKDGHTIKIYGDLGLGAL